MSHVLFLSERTCMVLIVGSTLFGKHLGARSEPGPAPAVPWSHVVKKKMAMVLVL